jgi:hypothetical protein
MTDSAKDKPTDQEKQEAVHGEGGKQGSRPETSSPPREPEAAPDTTRPPAGSPWADFFTHLIEILFRPSQAWERLSKDPQPLIEVLWPHVVVLLLARALAEFIGSLLQGRGILPSLGQFGLGAVGWFALVWAFGLVTMGIASARGGRVVVQDAIRYAGYGLTPLFVVGILSFVPVQYIPAVADALTMPYTFYVMAVGVGPMLRVPEEKLAGTVGLLNGALLLLWALIPTLLRIALRAMTS